MAFSSKMCQHTDLINHITKTLPVLVCVTYKLVLRIERINIHKNLTR